MTIHMYLEMKISGSWIGLYTLEPIQVLSKCIQPRV